MFEELNLGMDIVGGNLTISHVVTTLAIALGLSAIMFYTFKKVHSKMMYDENFNVMLVMISLIATMIMTLVSSNVALSLGMAGSLSLVRFRTNIKDNRDIGFVFWAMFIGLAAANKALFMGFLGSIIISMVLFISSRLMTNTDNLLLVIRGREADIGQIEAIINKSTKASNLKAHNILDDSFELVYDFRSDDRDQAYMAQVLKGIGGVDSVNILAPSAEM